MLVRILDAIETFIDRLGSVDPLPLSLAIGCHLLKMGCTAMAWRNALAAAYPGSVVRWRSIYGAYLAGVGVNAIAPARAGDAVRIVLAHRAIADSTYTTVISSTAVLALFDATVAGLLLAWAIATGTLPGLEVLSTLEGFDFAWLLSRPLLFQLLVSALLLALVLLAVWARGHVANLGQRIGQGFRILRPPRRYLGRVALWQAADWVLRLATIAFLLRAFDIPLSLERVLLVQVSQSLATLLPVTPAGIGTEQALLVVLLSGAAPASVLLSFSVGAKITLTITNVVAGFAALALTLRTVR
ncbi:MAG: flippase-like domain-containing protein, partial [Gaiellaceae bacterium]|nr:flippase-like domain-containing protein [Gaiellaceae bacterium]